MLDYILAIGLIGYAFLNYDTIESYIQIKYSKWKSLNNLVESQHKSKLMVKYISTKMVLQSFYQSLVQNLTRNVKKINKHDYELAYVINGCMYRKIITPSKGPNPVLRVEDENKNDVTALVMPYYGPCRDWHNQGYYPGYFGYKKLIFEMLSGEIFTFYERDIINLHEVHVKSN